MKVSRVKKRFLYLITRYSYVWFITFTFDDETISKSTRTKRDLIKSVINTHDFKYILNIDYGKSTEREHYHCVLATDINFDVSSYVESHYPCFTKTILCKKGKEDFLRLSKYINKLTNHCLKASTKRQRLVYNFKGYDNLDPYLSKLLYMFDKFKIFDDDKVLCRYVTQLDKGNITGENFT